MTGSSPRRLMVAILAAGGGACSDGAAPAADAVADMTIVAAITAETGPASFGNIRALGSDRRGRVFVLDAESQDVRVLDPVLEPTSFGRRGQGPGEFSDANGLAVDDEDRVWVYDPTNARLTMFDTDGRRLGDTTLAIRSSGYIWGGGLDRQGRVYDEELKRDEGKPTLVLRQTDLRTGTSRELPWPDCGVPDVPRFLYPRGGMSVPFAGGVFRRFDRRGFLWCGNSSTGALYRYAVDTGQPVDTVLLKLAAARVTARERDSVVQFATKFMERAGQATLDFGLIPATKAVLEALDGQRDGTVVVRAITAAGTLLIRLDSAGVELNRGRVPAGYSTLPWVGTAASDEGAVVAVEDADGAHLVLRLAWPARSANGSGSRARP